MASGNSFTKAEVLHALLPPTNLFDDLMGHCSFTSAWKVINVLGTSTPSSTDQSLYLHSPVTQLIAIPLLANIPVMSSFTRSNPEWWECNVWWRLIEAILPAWALILRCGLTSVDCGCCQAPAAAPSPAELALALPLAVVCCGLVEVEMVHKCRDITSLYWLAWLSQMHHR